MRFQLLPNEDELDHANVFDTDLLASRPIDVIGWLAGHPGIAVARPS
ncbi:hypothetical protein [Mycolicibacterium sp. 050158]